MALRRPHPCGLAPLVTSRHLAAFPQPTEEEIQFILDAIADYLVVKVGTPPAATVFFLFSVMLLHSLC